MSHTVSFDLFPCHPILTRCHITYKSEQVLESALLEKLARYILASATELWLRGNDQALDQEQNLYFMKEYLARQNETELAEMLDPFKSLLIQNDYFLCDNENNIVIQLE